MSEVRDGGISAEVIADSVSRAGIRITTMRLCYPKYIHGEFMTHRVFSRNARSSRAVPVEKVLREVEESPVRPLVWKANQRGMQAAEDLDFTIVGVAKLVWDRMARDVAVGCRTLAELGLHKQWANRPTEPFTNIYTLVTSTDWCNFYQLRRHPDAQPEMKELADRMHQVHRESMPTVVRRGGWHLPFVTERSHNPDRIDVLRRVSVARCARVSYHTFDHRTPTVEEDLDLYQKLVGSQPIHASPAEHQATPDNGKVRRNSLWGNFYGWVQYRKMLVGEQGVVDCGLPFVTR